MIHIIFQTLFWIWLILTWVTITVSMADIAVRIYKWIKKRRENA